MSNYTQSTNFATKDALSPGDPLKIVRGTEINTEFTNIAVAVATKLDTTALASPGPIGATTPAAISCTSLNGGQLAGLRNRIINGDMSVAQRGTSGALTTSYAYLSVDRFAGAQSTTASGVLAQVAAGLSGFSYAAKIGRTATSTNTGAIILRSALETINSVSLQNQQVTLSFYAKAGANFSATSSNITAQLFTGTGTDQSVSIMNTWTGSANPINTSTAITTTWTRYSFTATLSATATQVGITLFYTPVGTAGADDNLYVTGVQLEVGPVATPFEQRPIGMELALCQRYFQKSYQASTAPGTNSNVSIVSGYAAETTRVTGVVNRFPVVMRAQPNTQLYSETGTQNVVSTTSGVNAGSTMVASLVGDAGFGEIVGTGLTANTVVRAHWTASAEL